MMIVSIIGILFVWDINLVTEILIDCDYEGVAGHLVAPSDCGCKRGNCAYTPA